MNYTNFSKVILLPAILTLSLVFLIITATPCLSAENIIGLEIKSDLTGMTVISDHPINSYNDFILMNPSRIVIDIPVHSASVNPFACLNIPIPPAPPDDGFIVQ